MATGIEDTRFARYNAVISHNEVGGTPAILSSTIDELQDSNARRLRATPHALLGTSTHETKRGEDVRARLALLAEIPEAWSRHVTEWRALVAGESRALGD